MIMPESRTRRSKATRDSTGTQDLTRAEVVQARSHATWVHNFGSALIVGGGTFALTLMLGGVPLRRDVTVAFDVLYGVLLMCCAVLAKRVARLMKAPVPLPAFLNACPTGMAFLVLALFDAAGPSVGWPVKPYAGLVSFSSQTLPGPGNERRLTTSLIPALGSGTHSAILTRPRIRIIQVS